MQQPRQSAVRRGHRGWPRRGTLRARAVASLVLVLALARSTGAHGQTPAANDTPSNGKVVALGIALAAPTYVLGVAMHEGSHALVAKLTGARVVSLSILPGRDARTGAFHFGLTRVTGLRSPSQRAWFYMAPKIVDITLLAGFGVLVNSQAWPGHRYGQVALTVLATGWWIDFSKDLFTRSPHNDVIKAMHLYCVDTEWRRLPVRLLYAAAIAGLGVFVAQGYRQTFAQPNGSRATGLAADRATWVLPMLDLRF